jgi:hypothetical protein
MPECRDRLVASGYRKLWSAALLPFGVRELVLGVLIIPLSPLCGTQETKDILRNNTQHKYKVITINAVLSSTFSLPLPNA